MSSTESDTRKRILAATWRLMEERRGEGVRLSDIARAAGLSRQALYLHFSSRPDLLIATVRYADEVKDCDARLENVCRAASGQEALAALVEFWGNYIPEIYGLAKALLSVLETDAAAAAAWKDRMGALRDGCCQVIDALERQKALAPQWQPAEAVEMLWSLLSIAVWENLTQECGWSTAQYVSRMQSVLKSTFVNA